MLYWFLELVPIEVALKNCRISKEVLRESFYHIRMIMFERVQAMQASAPLLGGAGVFVAIDETFFTKKKYVRGGFVGRYTMGMLTCVLGMIEICLATRRATGRVRLLIIQNRDKSTIYAAIRQHVQRGSLIFTDGFKSYLWLSRRFSGFVHIWVNHRRGQFCRWET